MCDGQISSVVSFGSGTMISLFGNPAIDIENVKVEKMCNLTPIVQRQF
jgi:hypothetical protein